MPSFDLMDIHVSWSDDNLYAPRLIAEILAKWEIYVRDHPPSVVLRPEAPPVRKRVMSSAEFDVKLDKKQKRKYQRRKIAVPLEDFQATECQPA